jgi:hypothetical protein
MITTSAAAEHITRDLFLNHRESLEASVSAGAGDSALFLGFRVCLGAYGEIPYFGGALPVAIQGCDLQSEHGWADNVFEVLKHVGRQTHALVEYSRHH